MVLEFLQYFFITITAIFVIVNPLTTAFAFLAVLPSTDAKEREDVARRACIIATAVLLTCALTGSIIFKIFGITISAFRIAGGIILFGSAMSMIKQKKDPDKNLDSDNKVVDDLAVTPIAIPFISGPGSIATVMILTSEAPTVYHTTLVFVSIIAIVYTCYLAMIQSKVIVSYLGESGRKLATKIFGIILSVVAVQFVINGVSEAILNFIPQLTIIEGGVAK